MGNSEYSKQWARRVTSPSLSLVITGDFVVDSVCRALSAEGYTIVQRLLATERGLDIVAQRDGNELVIEAKGAGTSPGGAAVWRSRGSAASPFSHRSCAAFLRVALPLEGLRREATGRRGEEAGELQVSVYARTIAWLDLTSAAAADAGQCRGSSSP